MSKLARDALAYAARVRMSQDQRLFLLVEGRERDTRFYDKLLGASASISSQGYFIQLAELVSIDGVTAGGKKHLEKLFFLYRRKGLLRQASPLGDRVIAFAMDKDYDDILGRQKKSKHVVYTERADVDAEIFAHWRPKKALATALSLDSNEARVFARHVGDPIENLAQRWLDWLELCLRAEARGARCSVRPSAASIINASHYGKVDQAALSAKVAEVDARSLKSSGRGQQVANRFRAAARRGEAGRYLKGKLLPDFLAHEAQQFFAARRPIPVATFRGSITAVALGTVRFDGPWVRHWLDTLESL